MKKGFRGVRFVVHGMILGTAGLVFFSINRLMTRVDHFTCSIDARIAGPTYQAISSYVADNTTLMHSRAEQVCANIVHTFPVVHACTFHHVSRGIVHLAMQAADPLYVLNDDYILTHAMRVLPRTLYQESALVAVPGIVVDRPIQQSEIPLVASIPDDLARSFTTTWLNEHEIILRADDQDLFSIVCSADAFPSEKMVAACAHLKDELEQRGLFGKRRDKRWIADVRFDKQIILFPAQGRVGHG